MPTNNDALNTSTWKWNPPASNDQPAGSPHGDHRPKGDPSEVDKVARDPQNNQYGGPFNGAKPPERLPIRHDKDDATTHPSGDLPAPGQPKQKPLDPLAYSPH